ncbi:MAG: hypothetical protein PXZ08_03895 [Actinomycetota bacterium]|nr:hypothetical protein [Actinomycetota bacterium]
MSHDSLVARGRDEVVVATALRDKPATSSLRREVLRNAYVGWSRRRADLRRVHSIRRRAASNLATIACGDARRLTHLNAPGPHVIATMSDINP